MNKENPRSANPIDAYVGRRIKEAREEKGLSQESLADLLEISFQQVQKYERGANRVGASRLFALAKALDHNIEWFFDGLEEKRNDEDLFSVAELLSAPNSMELLRVYNTTSKQVQAKILDLVNIMAFKSE